MSPRRYLSSERFADEVNKLAPPWDGKWSLERYLEAFDESGELRPLYRVRLPERAVHYQAQRQGLDPLIALSPEETVQYEEMKYALDDVRDSRDDPESPSVFEEPPPELAQFVSYGTPDEVVRWRDWRVRVGGTDEKPFTRNIVTSFYAQWQRLRFWALIEQYSFRAFLDPRRIHPQDVLFDWDRDLRDRAMTWTVGDPRLNALTAELERDRWLDRLYRSREIIEWAQFRVYDPALTRWPDGAAMSSEERAETETRRARERCSALAELWLERRDDFYGRIRNLLEFWHRARERAAVKLAEAVEEDLSAAVRWAAFAFGVSFEDLDVAVGTGDPARRITLSYVLEPTRHQARHQAERSLTEFVTAFNETIPTIQLNSDDPKRFLDFLAANELDSWMLDFSAWVGEFQDPSDTAFEKRSLHLRSLALLHEQVLVTLADLHGTSEDQRKMQARSLKEPLKAFFADRRGDWRALAWQRVSDNYHLTETTTAGSSLFTRLDEIAALRVEPRVGGTAQTILALAAIRNFGSHRFVRETEQMRAHRGQMMRAVVLTPLLYWKVATTLG